MADREDHVYMAKLAEQAERYDDMVTSMKEVWRFFKNFFYIFCELFLSQQS